MAEHRRRKRVGELIRKEVAELLQRRAGDPRLAGVTLISAGVSADLRRCHLYFSSLGEEEERSEALAALEKAQGFLRRELAARLSLRHVPELVFHLDESFHRGARVDQLLREIEAEKTGKCETS
jgi:ribosome-binding factor A